MTVRHNMAMPAFFFPSLQTHPLPSPLRGVLLALNLTLSANHSVSVWGSHIFYIISKNSSNKVTQLYWVIIFIPPIHTQTIVKWVAKEGERTTTQTPTLPFTPNPSPRKPKNLNPDTLFFSYIDTYPENHASTDRGAVILFFCCRHVFWLSRPGC